MSRTGRDTLDTATARQASDRRLGDALDVVAENLPVALGSAFAQALAALAAWHNVSWVSGSSHWPQEQVEKQRRQRGHV